MEYWYINKENYIIVTEDKECDLSARYLRVDDIDNFIDIPTQFKSNGFGIHALPLTFSEIGIYLIEIIDSKSNNKEYKKIEVLERDMVSFYKFIKDTNNKVSSTLKKLIRAGY